MKYRLIGVAADCRRPWPVQRRIRDAVESAQRPSPGEPDFSERVRSDSRHRRRRTGSFRWRQPGPECVFCGGSDQVDGIVVTRICRGSCLWNHRRNVEWADGHQASPASLHRDVRNALDALWRQLLVHEGRHNLWFPSAVSSTGQRRSPGNSHSGLSHGAGLLAGGIFTRYTTFGHEIYAIGANVEAARLSGIPVGSRLILLYTLSGAMAGVAGVVYLARLNSAEAGIGTPLLLPAIAAVLIGGTSLFGGSGGLAGTMIGAIILTLV